MIDLDIDTHKSFGKSRRCDRGREAIHVIMSLDPNKEKSKSGGKP
jgi:hypothetical protein